ncbi:MAG: alpha/beta hydrolase [Caldisericia bacterium]|nr:alpha/beta hydrolase [Caldisericia bacterium]
MVIVEDIEVGYRIYGEGQPLILIMGYGSTMNLWEDSFLKTLSNHFKVIIFDNRGMGETSAGEKEFSIKQFSKDTLGLLDALAIEKTHVLGWSMGSYIAQELAFTNPDRVNKLILYASAPNPTMFPPSSEVLAKLEDTSGTPEEQGARWIGLLFPEKWIENNEKRIQEIFYRPMGTILPENIGKQSMAIGEWKGLEEQLSTFHHHTLLIAGKEDVLVPPANSIYLKEKLPKSDIEIIEGTGHGFMFQEPTQFLQIVIEFLKK